MIDRPELIKDVVVNVVLIGGIWFVRHRKEIDKVMSLVSVLTQLYQLVPYIVAGVETIHTGESTESKTQIAQNVLQIATQGALQVLGPQNSAVASAVSNALSSGITSVQAVIQASQSPSTSNSTTPTSTPMVASVNTPSIFSQLSPLK